MAYNSPTEEMSPDDHAAAASAEVGRGLRPGTQLGPYRLLAEVGRGGMGVVYRAEDTTLDRVVAVKVLPAHLAADDARLARFFREARAGARLSHPNIVPIFLAGSDRGIAFLAMGFVEGRTLRQVLHDDGPFPWKKAVSIVRTVADALHHAHRLGVVHRDVKPDNIMLDEQGRVMIMDFGLAHLIAETPAEEPERRAGKRRITRHGFFVGTPEYAPPEQIAGLVGDARTDLYSLGAILHEMLTGQPPFPRGNDLQVFRAIRHDAPPRLSASRTDVPSVLQGWVDHLMAKEPDDRPDSAATVVQWCTSLLQAPPPSGAARLRPSTMRLARYRQASRRLSWQRVGAVLRAWQPPRRGFVFTLMAVMVMVTLGRVPDLPVFDTSPVVMTPAPSPVQVALPAKPSPKPPVPELPLLSQPVPTRFRIWVEDFNNGDTIGAFDYLREAIPLSLSMSLADSPLLEVLPTDPRVAASLPTPRNARNWDSLTESSQLAIQIRGSFYMGGPGQDIQIVAKFHDTSTGEVLGGVTVEGPKGCLMGLLDQLSKSVHERLVLILNTKPDADVTA